MYISGLDDHKHTRPTNYPPYSIHTHSSYDTHKANVKGKYIIQKLFLACYGTPQLSGYCGYEFFSTYHRVGKDKYRNYEHDWEKIWDRSEQLLRDQVRDVEEILLMQAICNHIAATVYSFL